MFYKVGDSCQFIWWGQYCHVSLLSWYYHSFAQYIHVIKWTEGAIYWALGFAGSTLYHHSGGLSMSTLSLLNCSSFIQESHPYPRQIPPHGSCFKGDIITLEVTYDQTTFKMEVWGFLLPGMYMNIIYDILYQSILVV